MREFAITVGRWSDPALEIIGEGKLSVADDRVFPDGRVPLAGGLILSWAEIPKGFDFLPKFLRVHWDFTAARWLLCDWAEHKPACQYKFHGRVPLEPGP